MKKHNARKLPLATETIRSLERARTALVAGGRPPAISDRVTCNSCLPPD